jgi:MFS superfamily sulfate permease-like transporter
LKSIFSHFKSDVFAGLIVFFVALPLCLGIALACGAPLISAIITGIIGGIVVGLISQSHVSVSGPAAGLTAIVVAAISSLGSFELFLTSVVLAGLFQLLLGLVRAGNISNYFPPSVIEGMLTGIGIIIILKQIPHATGLTMQSGAIIISIVSLIILIGFKKTSFFKNNKYLPAELIVVITGVFMNQYFIMSDSFLKIQINQLVQLPVVNDPKAIFSQLYHPDFNGLYNYRVWITAFTIAVVASIETLFCLEAAEKLDPMKRHAGSNRELAAQGIGNMLSGFLGGLPMSSVIVRTSANVSSGAKTKLSTITHGILLLMSLIFFAVYINKIPLASLAAILIMIGFKLSNPSVFIQVWKAGRYQFIPFIVTVMGVVFTDLLIGVMMGMIVSVAFRKQINPPESKRHSD